MKLLRLLQEHEYYPLGSDTARKSKARIVVATNRDLQKKIGEDKFRNDLYYRLRTHQVHIPPLRERPEDIPLFSTISWTMRPRTLRKKKPAYPRELITLLMTYHFPGNVRELETMVFDGAARHKSGVLSLDHFRKQIEHDQQHRDREPFPEAITEPSLPRLPTASPH